MKRTQRAAPAWTQLKILEALKRFPDGITATALSKVLGIDLQARLSRLHAYSIIDRVAMPKTADNFRTQYIYRTRLPTVAAPPAADTDQRADAPISEDA